MRFDLKDGKFDFDPNIPIRFNYRWCVKIIPVPLTYEAEGIEILKAIISRNIVNFKFQLKL